MQLLQMTEHLVLLALVMMHVAVGMLGAETHRQLDAIELGE